MAGGAVEDSHQKGLFTTLLSSVQQRLSLHSYLWLSNQPTHAGWLGPKLLSTDKVLWSAGSLWGRTAQFQAKLCVLWGKLFNMSVFCFLIYNMGLIREPT